MQTVFQSSALIGPRTSPADPLAAVDWDFADSEKRDSIHRIHPYPAKFIPEIPSSLIDLLKPVNDGLVLDPFCGSGTTLVAAQKAGLRSFGIDLNPIACLISRVKTRRLPADFLVSARSCISEAKADRLTQVPPIPNVEHWFTSGAMIGLSRLIAAVNQIDSIRAKDALRMAVSSIIVRVSNQDSDTRYASVHRATSEDDVYTHFEVACKRIVQMKDGDPATLPEADVLERNILSVEASDIPARVGMMITSPPYPNAYEYWLYHKYRMWWLGYDPLEVKRQEIGARAHYFKKNPPTAEDFKAQMGGVLRLTAALLCSGGYACVIIGRSRVHGKDIDNTALIDHAAADAGLVSLNRVERRIAHGRKSFNLSHARIKTESILIYGKP